MGKDLNGKELGTGIIQKKNGRYEARYVDRFGKRISISGKDLKDVKARYNEALYENEQQINIKKSITLNSWYQIWMETYKKDVIKPTSKIYYDNIFFKFISPVIGNLYLSNIKQIDIKNIINDLTRKNYSFETKNKVKILLSDIFNKAILNEYVQKNPTKGLSIKRDKNLSDNIEVLSIDEQTTFFDYCKGTFYDNFFVVAISSGLRIGEIAALEETDLDMKNKIIHVTKTLIYAKLDGDNKKTFHLGSPKTSSSYRDVPMTKQCENALKKQIVQKHIVTSKAPVQKKIDEQFSNLLFTTKFNTPINSQIICDVISKNIQEINLMKDPTEEMKPFSAHCFRHTFATRCFEAGIQPKTVQSYLGHATLQMTMDLYTSVLKQHSQDEMNKVENLFSSLGLNQSESIEYMKNDL